MRSLTLYAAVLALSACSSDPSPAGAPDATADVTDAATDAATDATADVPAAPSTWTATTQRGPVIGHVLDGVTSFLGVPYAAPPVGPLRWRPPTDAPAWTQPRDAAAKGATCPQTPGMLAGVGPQSEDCLFVNVWTPRTSAADTTRRAVMVFIHGGGFTAGTTSDGAYDGDSLAAKGVVVVNFNYRLGQLGFLAHPALSTEDAAHHVSGNYGFMDQQAALRWVRDNAAAFGGDPAKVTLFGESAGSISVCAHMVAPASDGLFQQAISESGPCTVLATPLRAVPALPMYESAEALGGLFATAVGCAGMPDVPACMRAKPVDMVLAAAARPVELSRFSAHYQLNVDGYVFRETPWASFVAGRFMHIPVISGSNRDEGTAFTLDQTIPDAAAYETAVRALVPDHSADILRLYTAAEYGSPKEAFEAFLTDAVFLCPARAQARLTSAANPATYLYHFTHLTQIGQATGLGVFHTAELPFVFGNFTGLFRRAPGDDAVVEATQGYWTRFAATGDPNGGGAPAWPRFTAASDAHLEFNDTPRAGTALHRAHCDAIEAWIAPPPVTP